MSSLLLEFHYSIGRFFSPILYKKAGETSGVTIQGRDFGCTSSHDLQVGDEDVWCADIERIMNTHMYHYRQTSTYRYVTDKTIVERNCCVLVTMQWG